MGYNLLITGIYWGYNTFTNAFPNFLGDPSTPHPKNPWQRSASSACRANSKTFEDAWHKRVLS